VVGVRAWWSAEAVVEGDCGGEREEACADAGGEAVQGWGAVAFEGEQVVAGLEDRLDPLSDRREVQPFSGLAFAARPHDRCVELGGGAFEVAAGVAFVAEHVEVSGSRAALEQREAGVAFGGLGRGESQRAWGAVEGEQPVQAEAPEVAAVTDAGAVIGCVGELAATGRLDAAAAFDRGRTSTRSSL
jgi:hypothetical protein